MAKILVIDDDTRLRNLLSQYLNDNNFLVSTAKDGEEARQIMAVNSFDLLILDVMLPKESGINLAKFIRQTSKVPIIMLTARGNPQDRIDGLESGADDYMQKPFEPKELVLRIRNILNRSVKNNSTDNSNINISKNICKFGNFTFDFSNLRLKKDDQYFHITEGEAKIINILCQNLGIVISREKLSELCGEIDARSIDVQITRLRRKIENDPKKPTFLQTIRNQGYILYA